MLGLAPQLISDELYEQAQTLLKTLSQTNRAAIRLRAIVSAKEFGVNLVAKVFGVTSNTLRAWVKAFSKESYAGLDYQPGRGRKSKITEEHKQAIMNWIKADCTITIQAIVEKLKDVYKLHSSRSAVHRVLHQLKLSYITPRPTHHKQNASSHQEFKKKSARSPDSKPS